MSNLERILDKAFGKKPTGEIYNSQDVSKDRVRCDSPLEDNDSKPVGLKPPPKVEKVSAQYQKKKATRGSIRGIKTFLELPEDHTKGATIYTETQDVINYLIKCIKKRYWD